MPRKKPKPPLTMTEERWFDSGLYTQMVMEAFLGERHTPRKRLLFGCGIARQLWHLLQREVNRRAVETSERYADGLATRAEMEQTWHSLDWEPVIWCEWILDSVCGGVGTNEPDLALSARLSSEGNAFRRTPEARQRAACDMIRELHGNPCRPVLLDAAWLTGNDGSVARLARGIYDQRSFEHLPILADALEEAGCAADELLIHLRETRPHYLGCWALDLLLGKQ